MNIWVDEFAAARWAQLFSGYAGAKIGANNHRSVSRISKYDVNYPVWRSRGRTEQRAQEPSRRGRIDRANSVSANRLDETVTFWPTML